MNCQKPDQHQRVKPNLNFRFVLHELLTNLVVSRPKAHHQYSSSLSILNGIASLGGTQLLCVQNVLFPSTR